jgi:hypothetical protein
MSWHRRDVRDDVDQLSCVANLHRLDLASATIASATHRAATTSIAPTALASR